MHLVRGFHVRLQHQFLVGLQLAQAFQPDGLECLSSCGFCRQFDGLCAGCRQSRWPKMAIAALGLADVFDAERDVLLQLRSEFEQAPCLALFQFELYLTDRLGLTVDFQPAQIERDLDGGAVGMGQLPFGALDVGDENRP